jgi:hypothetical protein
MMKLVAAALTIAALSTSSFADECKPVDALKLSAEERVGMKAWIFEAVGTKPFDVTSEWPKADIYEQVGPDTYTKTGKVPRLEYGQEVEILQWQKVDGSLGRYKVKLPDGSTRFLHAQAVHLFEFWKCPATTLIEKRRIDPMRPQETKYMHSAWVRISNPKAVATNDSRKWIPEETLASYAFAICDDYQPEAKKHRPWEEPLRCMGFKPGVRGGTSFYIEPSAVETISPTSMKILFAS